MTSNSVRTHISLKDKCYRVVCTPSKKDAGSADREAKLDDLTRLDDLLVKYANDPDSHVWRDFLNDLMDRDDVDLDEHVDLDKAHKQGRAFKLNRTNDGFEFVVLAGRAFEAWPDVNVGDCWLVNGEGQKWEGCFPNPIPLRMDCLRDLAPADRDVISPDDERLLIALTREEETQLRVIADEMPVPQSEMVGFLYRALQPEEQELSSDGGEMIGRYSLTQKEVRLFAEGVKKDYEAFPTDGFMPLLTGDLRKKVLSLMDMTTLEFMPEQVPAPSKKPKFKLVSSELDRQFQIVDEVGDVVAIPHTVKSFETANWNNKKLAAKMLWESVASPREQQRVNDLLAQTAPAFEPKTYDDLAGHVDALLAKHGLPTYSSLVQALNTAKPFVEVAVERADEQKLVNAQAWNADCLAKISKPLQRINEISQRQTLDVKAGLSQESDYTP